MIWQQTTECPMTNWTAIDMYLYIMFVIILYKYGELLNSSSLRHSCQKIMLNNTFKVALLTSSESLSVVLNIYWGGAGIDRCPQYCCYCLDKLDKLRVPWSSGNIDRFYLTNFKHFIISQIVSGHSILYHPSWSQRLHMSVNYFDLKIDSFPLGWLFWRMWCDHKNEMS